MAVSKPRVKTFILVALRGGFWEGSIIDIETHLWETRPHRIHNWNGSRVRYGHHIWSELYAIPILIMQVLMYLVGSFTSHPPHSLEVCELCPKWTGDILMFPICTKYVIAEVRKEESSGHNGRAWFLIHVCL